MDRNHWGFLTEHVICAFFLLSRSLISSHVQFNRGRPAGDGGRDGLVPGVGTNTNGGAGEAEPVEKPRVGH
jgi:hypothetical protein